MNKRLLNYLFPAVLFGVFTGVMVLYGMAFTPPAAKKQMVVCYKFKPGVDQAGIEKHMVDFKNLKKASKEIVGYTAGFTLNDSPEKKDFDVMHHLTFKSDEDIEKYRESAAYKSFVQDHSNLWEKQFEIRAEIK